MKRDDMIKTVRKHVEDALDASTQPLMMDLFNKFNGAINGLGWLPQDRQRIDAFVIAQVDKIAIRYRVKWED